VGQTSLWRRAALRPLSAPAPPPEVGGEPSLHPPSVAPAARLEPPPQATGTCWPGLLGRRAHLARDGRGCGALVATHPPLRPGAAGWASGIPAGSPLPRGPFWPSPFLRGSTPRRFRYSPSGEASFPWGRARGPGPPPRWCQGRPWGWKPPGCRSRLSALVAGMTSLHDTTGHPSGTPCGSRFGLAYSPGLPLWCERLIPGPSGFPPRACTTTSRRGFAALRYGHRPESPQPVRPSRPEVPPLAGSYHASTPL
jgi:hypothetical protein